MKGNPLLVGDLVISGKSKTIYFARTTGTGRQPAEEFILGRSAREQKKIFALIERYANRDNFDVNTDQCRKVKGSDNIFALLTGAMRILYFHDVDNTVLLVGGGVINRKLRDPLVAGAEQLRREYFQDSRKVTRLRKVSG